MKKKLKENWKTIFAIFVVSILIYLKYAHESAREKEILKGKYDYTYPPQ